MTHPDDDVIVRGDPATGKFSVVYLREGRLAAVDTVADWPISARPETDPCRPALDPGPGCGPGREAPETP